MIEKGSMFDMHKKRRIIRSIYIVFALIFLLILGMDLYRYVQPETSDKATDKTNAKNKAVTSQNISKINETATSSIDSENSKENIEELNVTESYNQKKFFVAVYQNRIIVYLEDKKTVYEYTNIDTKELPLELRAKLSDGFFLSGEEELYHFLESYSS